MDIEELYNKAAVHSINTSKGDLSDVGVFSDNSQVTVFGFLESAELAYLGWGDSIQKANQAKHLSDKIKSQIINISDNYSLINMLLITNYCGWSRIIGDIINNLSRKSKPVHGSRKEKFVFYSAITGAIQRLERLSRMKYIDKVELGTCTLSRSMLSSSVRLLPASEYNLWVQKMTISGLDFKNPVGIETFDCFKRVCTKERNTNKSLRSDPIPKEVQNTNKKGD